MRFDPPFVSLLQASTMPGYEDVQAEARNSSALQQVSKKQPQPQPPWSMPPPRPVEQAANESASEMSPAPGDWHPIFESVLTKNAPAWTTPAFTLF
jgi:hypothetical protein